MMKLAQPALNMLFEQFQERFVYFKKQKHERTFSSISKIERSYPS